MTRIRIVGGKIIKTTKGNHNIYSEGSIVQNAGGTISEIGEEKGVSFGKTKKAPKPEKIAKCGVEFRPTKDGKGEFGFDWSRKGDRKLAKNGTDINYKGIIGKYGSTYATESGAVFTPKNTDYNKHLLEYSSFFAHKTDYRVPHMTLIKDRTAILDVITNVEEEPDKLYYVYEKSLFELTIMKKLTSSKGKHYDEGALKIKCLKEFSTKQSIRIIASKNKYLEKVGEIFVLPQKIKKLNFILIPVKYDKGIGAPVLDELTIFKNAMNQAYIEPNIITYKKHIIVKGLWFEHWFTKKDTKGNTILTTSSLKSIHSWLDSEFFKDKENDKYKDYFRIYMMTTGDLNGIAADVGNNAKSVVVYSNRNRSTMPHEIMHALGLYHTFDNDGLFTYKLYNTDNIMDYTHKVPGKERFSTNKWQWKILNSGI